MTRRPCTGPSKGPRGGRGSSAGGRDAREEQAKGEAAFGSTVETRFLDPEPPAQHQPDTQNTDPQRGRPHLPARWKTIPEPRRSVGDARAEFTVSICAPLSYQILPLKRVRLHEGMEGILTLAVLGPRGLARARAASRSSPASTFQRLHFAAGPQGANFRAFASKTGRTTGPKAIPAGATAARSLGRGNGDVGAVFGPRTMAGVQAREVEMGRLIVLESR